jgi:hypothetical protein
MSKKIQQRASETEKNKIIMSNMKNIETFRACFFIFMLIVSGCTKNSSSSTGTLEGKISIGPLCPVVTDPPAPACLPDAETYKAYPVVIWTSDGKDKITQINPSLDGYYSVELRQGNYLVRLDREQNAAGGSNLPAEVTIVSEQTTILDINIDTGIR